MFNQLAPCERIGDQSTTLSMKSTKCIHATLHDRLYITDPTSQTLHHRLHSLHGSKMHSCNTTSQNLHHRLYSLHGSFWNSEGCSCPAGVVHPVQLPHLDATLLQCILELRLLIICWPTPIRGHKHCSCKPMQHVDTCVRVPSLNFQDLVLQNHLGSLGRVLCRVIQ